MKKRMAALTLCMAMVASMTACGTTETDTASNDGGNGSFYRRTSGDT